MVESRKFLERLIERLDRVDRRELEEHLLALESRRGILASIFNSMQEGILVLDVDRRVLLVNRAAREILALAPGREGDAVEEIISSPAVLDILVGGFEFTRQSLVRDVFLPESGSRWVRLSRSPLLAEDGEFRGVMLVASDVTRRQRSQREATLAEKVDFLTYLTAAVAHELGNPIASLSLHLQLMQRQIRQVKGEPGRKLEGSAGVLAEEMRRLDGIVRQFLQALRPGRLQLRETDPASVIEEVLAMLAPEMDGLGVKISLDPPSRPVPARFDPDQVKQALINLIRNAAQATGEGGRIWIGWSPRGGYLEIRVSDDGRGIPAEEVPRVMEPFFSTREGGSGLGFLVVYRIVRQHGGTVEIKSEAGEGTTVTFWLPRRPDDIKRLPEFGEREE